MLPLTLACLVAVPQVWQALAAVLHMSNLSFDKVDNEQGEIAAISDRAVSSKEYPTSPLKLRTSLICLMTPC